ncbi:MAG: hypothetical protein ACREXS_07060 [Gammaproteobacteria bacterium]
MTFFNLQDIENELLHQAPYARPHDLRNPTLGKLIVKGLVAPNNALKPRWSSANVSTFLLASVESIALTSRNGVTTRSR